MAISLSNQRQYFHIPVSLMDFLDAIKCFSRVVSSRHETVEFIFLIQQKVTQPEAITGT